MAFDSFAQDMGQGAGDGSSSIRLNSASDGSDRWRVAAERTPTTPAVAPYSDDLPFDRR